MVLMARLPDLVKRLLTLLLTPIPLTDTYSLDEITQNSQPSRSMNSSRFMHGTPKC